MPADHDRLQAFYAGLSEESRRTRFLGPTNGIGDRQSTYFCCPDHAHREGFVATMGPADGPDRIVGHVCIEPDGPDTAEVAVAVADELQGHGIGRRLVDAAVYWARSDGFRTLTATMLAGNPAIQRLLTGLGLPSTAVAIGAGVVEVRIDLGRRQHGRLRRQLPGRGPSRKTRARRVRSARTCVTSDHRRLRPAGRCSERIRLPAATTRPRRNGTEVDHEPHPAGLRRQ